MNDVKFAAQQLSKKEMNEVKGGLLFKCVCKKEEYISWTKDYTGDTAQITRQINEDVRNKCMFGGECNPIGIVIP